MDARDEVLEPWYLDATSLENINSMNRFKLKPGQWTDDASMAACLSDSIIARGAYDGSDARTRFWNWWFRGYCNAFANDPSRHNSVGLGGNVKKSLEVMKPCVVPSPKYEAVTEDMVPARVMGIQPNGAISNFS